MKKIILSFLFILFISTSTFGEVKKEKYTNGYYIGEFNTSGTKHGHGIYYWDNGSTFAGKWAYNNRVYGKHTFKNKQYSYAYYSEDKISYGSYHWINGNRFIGRISKSVWYGKYLSVANSGEFKKNRNDQWLDSTYSESNSHYKEGLAKSKIARDSYNTAINIVKKFNNKTKEFKYCKKNNNQVYKTYSNCQLGEIGISKIEYNRIINNSSYQINKFYYSHGLKVRIRSKPNTSSDIIGHLTKGETIFVTKKFNSKPWFIVKYRNKTGYVHASYLKNWKPYKKETTEKINKPKIVKGENSFNPATLVSIGLGFFLFYFIFIRKKKKTPTDWKKYTKESATRYKSESTKKTSYVSKTSSPSSDVKTDIKIKKGAPVGGKKTNKVGSIIIKKTPKTRKKGIICKYCNSENKYTAVICVSCNKSLS